jgi:hypothetical protein
MAGGYRVTIRAHGASERTRYPTLAAALDALEAGLRAAAQQVRPETRHALRRTYEPIQQVAVRGELRGPQLIGGLRAGIDVRGDGSPEAFTGWLVRRVIEQRDDEDAYAALRRVASEA